MRRFCVYLAAVCVLAGCSKPALQWTEGQPAFFASSNLATRGFCRDCGTPLTFSYNTPEARIYVTIGSMDDPARAEIEVQYGVESKIRWVRFCENVPAEVTGDSPAAQEFFAGMVSHQG